MGSVFFSFKVKGLTQTQRTDYSLPPTLLYSFTGFFNMLSVKTKANSIIYIKPTLKPNC